MPRNQFTTYKLPKGAYEASLKPYTGRLFMAATREAFEAAYKLIYGEECKVTEHQGGRFVFGHGKDLMATYLIWANRSPGLWAHEISHVLLDLLPKMGFNLNNVENDEAFCYMIEHLMNQTPKQ